ncbi:MAG: hypothetical protein Q8Q58_08140, partial [Candidatus Rokubacteria bacterium]|nr:hypothetical protein [Candidatus Rokubacteria bacterium]
SMADVVPGVAQAVEALVKEKTLELEVALPPELPAGRGDERRLHLLLHRARARRAPDARRRGGGGAPVAAGVSRRILVVDDVEDSPRAPMGTIRESLP